MSEREYPPVLTKRDFTVRYQAGEFGNASPTWHTLDDFWESGWAERSNQLFHLRNRVAGGETHYNLTAWDLACRWKGVSDPSQFYCSAMAPTQLTLFQGEVFEGFLGLNLFYSTVRKPMRNALAERAEQTWGTQAKMLIAYYLDINSREWLQTLFERYPEHVVEFSTYGTQWGTVPGYNTVFWEVRRY